MMTSAGTLRNTTSQGSAKESTPRRRPITSPSAVPAIIDSAKAAATRASVTARLKNNAPEPASAPMVANTAIGAGRKRGDAPMEANCQIASRTTSDAMRAKSQLPARQNVPGCSSLAGPTSASPPTSDSTL